MLDVRDLHAHYGRSHVLQGVSLGAPEGTVVALLGRNGAGKTTLARTIFGFQPASAGSIRFGARDITNLAPHRIANNGLALVPQGRRLFRSLSVAEHLSLTARRNGAGTWTPESVLDLFPRLRERLSTRAGHLSGGEQQMLAIARALVRNPRCVVMDEPTEGLAPNIVLGLVDLLHRLREAGMAVLLVEQNLGFALDCADYVYVLNKGVIVYEGSAAAFREHGREVQERYLGI